MCMELLPRRINKERERVRYTGITTIGAALMEMMDEMKVKRVEIKMERARRAGSPIPSYFPHPSLNYSSGPVNYNKSSEVPLGHNPNRGFRIVDAPIQAMRDRTLEESITLNTFKDALPTYPLKRDPKTGRMMKAERV